MKAEIKAHTNGKTGLTEEAREVLISKLEIGYSSLSYYPEDPFHGELRAYFDGSGFTPGSWNVDGYGLIYADKLWLREFKRGLKELGLSVLAARDVQYSGQDRQGLDYVSLDIGPTFYASWKRLNKETK